MRTNILLNLKEDNHKNALNKMMIIKIEGLGKLRVKDFEIEFEEDLLGGRLQDLKSALPNVQFIKKEKKPISGKKKFKEKTNHTEEDITATFATWEEWMRSLSLG